MAERDASLVQLDFPQLTADIIAALRLTGTLGLFNMSDTVIPVISVGNVRPQTFTFEPPTFQSAEIVHGAAIAPAANTVVVDTGPLAAGTYNLSAQLTMAANVSVGVTPMVLQHRNAANAATLATLLSIAITTTRIDVSAILAPVGYVIALNERIRILSPSAVMSGNLAGSIYTALRPTP